MIFDIVTTIPIPLHYHVCRGIWFLRGSSCFFLPLKWVTRAEICFFIFPRILQNDQLQIGDLELSLPRPWFCCYHFLSRSIIYFLSVFIYFHLQSIIMYIISSYPLLSLIYHLCQASFSFTLTCRCFLSCSCLFAFDLMDRIVCSAMQALSFIPPDGEFSLASVWSPRDEVCSSGCDAVDERNSALVGMDKHGKTLDMQNWIFSLYSHTYTYTYIIYTYIYKYIKSTVVGF